MTEQAHPEELIELHRKGKLSEAARAELTTHLELCSVCAAEVWALTFMVPESEPVAGDSERDRLAVLATLAKLGPKPVLSKPKRPAWVWLLAAALPLCAFGALSPGWSRIPQASPAIPSAAASSSATHGTLEPAAVPSATTAPSASPTTPGVPSGVPATSGSTLPDAPRISSSARSESLGPSALLRRAGDLGRQGKQTQAIGVYRELQQRFAASPEARLSRVLLGTLLLAQDEYSSAVAEFDRYLAGSGPASEEALAGRASALHALGDRAEEAASWRSLLQKFPQSVHASQARKRLTELAGNAGGSKTP